MRPQIRHKYFHVILIFKNLQGFLTTSRIKCKFLRINFKALRHLVPIHLSRLSSFFFLCKFFFPVKLAPIPYTWHSISLLCAFEQVALSCLECLIKSLASFKAWFKWHLPFLMLLANAPLLLKLPCITWHILYVIAYLCNHNLNSLSPGDFGYCYCSNVKLSL